MSLGLTGLASTPAVRHSAGVARHATLDASTGPLTTSQAQAQAVASGQPVTATALTTPA